LKRHSMILLMLVGVVLTIAVIVLSAYICETGRFSAAVYRYTGSGKWLYSTLYHGVQNGDTIEQVEQLLGPGKKGGAKLLNSFKRLAEKYPESCPDGYKEADEAVGFPLPGSELYLQFRNGVLINFDPTDFEKYEEPQIIG